MENDYTSVMSRRSEILLKATGIDYARVSRGRLAFDYDNLMANIGYDLHRIAEIQRQTGVGNTPLLELRNVTELVRRRALPGKGARIFVKDEAANPSGSFKDRRAALSAYHAKLKGYPGLVAATSGNYGAAVAAQSAAYGLKAIVVQEVFDSAGRGQPEILEKGRKCEALGAEVLQTTVGPELFYMLLRVLEETGYFNASLYTPFSIAGIETLGFEIAQQTREATGRFPDAVLATHAGGGMVTGTARGLRAAGAADTEIIGVSVDLQGLHMASDKDFNRKSFTTGHTGFSVPFTTWPDRVDVPRNAARPLRYLDRFLLVSQGQVFYATELLARLEGLERGPAGNTSLAAALVLARTMDRDRVLVVTETEYTGAGKVPNSQLAFARSMGVDVRYGGEEDSPGNVICIPSSFDALQTRDVDLATLKTSFIRKAVGELRGLLDGEAEFISCDSRSELADVMDAANTWSPD
ncbi:PLP-dependent lyase/thiolase [Mesorhizobium sp. Root102]|uniref:2-amino-4-oxopentanoate thiolase subunit OrtB n=1 Tax=Mesorhizobium sp. Root102 TaxID=1736422 RepID=UPI0006FB9B68|nr:2-amino-4-oxopentanoate thiolase subunit OrtB [Mesorhizobium sp. Root102]KQU92806.1 PLP-dependent lyase/thiolase [Mesorhizobium sp. Root102]